MHERQGTEAAPAHQQRHDDRGAQADRPDQLEVRLVPRGRDEQLVGHVLHDDRHPAAGDVDGAAGGVRVRRVAPLELLDERDLRGVEVGDGDPLDARPADEVHRGPVGDALDDEVAELAQALLHRQRRLHQPARLRQEGHAVPLALGGGARFVLGGVEPRAVERLGAQRGRGHEELPLGRVEGPGLVEAEDHGAEVAVLDAQRQAGGGLVALGDTDRGHLRVARAPLPGVLQPHRRRRSRTASDIGRPRCSGTRV